MNSDAITGSIGAELLLVEESLNKAGTPRPRRHAELIVQTALELDRTAIYLNARKILSTENRSKINELLKRRLEGEPIQYIAGWAPFFGRKFHVYEGVFIPRFDTELLIERFLGHYNQLPDTNEITRVLDLCCGSGAIGLTIAAEAPRAQVTLVDISTAALECTSINAKSIGVQDSTQLVNWDTLTDPPENWTHQFDFIVANPPYIHVEEVEQLHPDVQREPHAALTDGGDGLKFYRHWVKILPQLLVPGGRFITEIGFNEGEDVSRIMSESFDAVKVFEDLNDLPRVVEGKLS